MAKRWIDTTCKCSSDYVCVYHQFKNKDKAMASKKRTKSQMILEAFKRFDHYSKEFFKLNQKGHFKEAGKALTNMWRMYDIVTRNRTRSNHKETR